MKALIISGGKAPSLKLLKNALLDTDYIIAVDGGAKCLHDYNILPDILVGDLDSICDDALAFIVDNNVTILKFPKEKDMTDTEIAIEEAIKIGIKSIVFLGCTGSRVDHLLGNIGLLIKCSKHNINSIIVDDNNEIYLLKENTTIKGDIGECFSLQAYFENVIGLSIEGAKYNLNKYNLSIGDGITISNEFNAKSVTISFESGSLLLFKSRD